MWGVTGIAARNEKLFSSDAHGNTDAGYDGPSVKRYTYDAYGNAIRDNGEDDNPYRYCGENYDEETGLYYLRARYYDPSIGRFMSEDPAQDGLNWYVYCGNNPVMFVDPSGLDIELRHMAENQYGAKVSWNEYNRTALVSFSNGISYTFTADSDDDDTAYISDDGIMYVDEQTFQSKLCITSHSYQYISEADISVILNVFEYESKKYRMEISLNNVVRYSDESKKYVRISNAKLASLEDYNYMSGNLLNDIISAYSEFQTEAGLLSEMFSFNKDDVHLGDIRVDTNENVRYFFDRNTHQYATKSKYIWLYCF